MYASDYRLKARENLAGNWVLSMLVAFVAGILGGSVTGASYSIDIDTETISQLPPEIATIFGVWLSVAGVLSIVQFIIGGPITLGNCRYLLNQYDKKDFHFNDLFSEFGRWSDGFVLKLLMALFTALWTLLFIIPGIVASYSYAMAPFILAENPQMSASEAIKASKEMMKGHKWELFCLSFSFIGWAFLCALTLGIGALFLNPYTAASYAAFYRNLAPAYTPEPTPEIPTAETPWDF